MIRIGRKRWHRLALSLLICCVLSACAGGAEQRVNAASVPALATGHFDAYLRFQAQPAAGAHSGGAESGAAPSLPICSFSQGPLR